MKNKVLTVFEVLFVVFLGALLVGCGEINVDVSTNNSKKDYSQSETATLNNVNYSVVKIERLNKIGDIFTASEGKEYYVVTVKIENRSNETISYNSINFQLVNGDGTEVSHNYITYGNPLNSGELAPGEIKEGTILWHETKGDTNKKLRYYNNVI